MAHYGEYFVNDNGGFLCRIYNKESGFVREFEGNGDKATAAAAMAKAVKEADALEGEGG